MPSGVFLPLPCCASDPVTNGNELQIADHADHNQRGAFLPARYQTTQRQRQQRSRARANDRNSFDIDSSLLS